jgi:phage gpG-like protein
MLCMQLTPLILTLLPVDTIHAYASKFTPRPGMNEKACMPKNKWIGLDQKAKDLWDQIDDTYK